MPRTNPTKNSPNYKNRSVRQNSQSMSPVRDQDSVNGSHDERDSPLNSPMNDKNSQKRDKKTKISSVSSNKNMTTSQIQMKNTNRGPQKIIAGGADRNVSIEMEEQHIGGTWKETVTTTSSSLESTSGNTSLLNSSQGTTHTSINNMNIDNSYNTNSNSGSDRTWFQYLYGDMTQAEFMTVLWFGGTLFFIIGGYWLLRSLKDTVMVSINGVEYIPQAKMVSLVVVFALVFVYNKLLDILPKHQLFYYVGLFYFVTFAGISYLLSTDTYGLGNTEVSPSRLLGWFSYCAIESFGSIGVALFWAFVNASMSLEGQKKAYGLIIAGAQIGSILGPTLVIRAHSIGVPRLYFIGSLCMLAMVVLIYIYVQQFGSNIDSGSDSTTKPQSQQQNKKDNKKAKPGVLEGFYLFYEHTYVRGIFALSCLFMVEVTILDYIMKVLAKRQFTAMYPDDPLAVTESFASFMGLFGQTTNTISFIFSLTGTSFIIRKIGLYKSLIAFPILCLFGIGAVLLFPNLWVVFGSMMFLKALSYSLNNPCKEMLYNPTSTAIKFKSKSWIDIFGQRGAKAAGSVVTNALSDSVGALVTWGSFVSIGISAYLVFVAAWMGNKFNEYTETGFVVGETEDIGSSLGKGSTFDKYKDIVPEKGREEDEDDTSCGVMEEGQEDHTKK